MDGISEEDVQLVRAALSSITPILLLIVRNAWRIWIGSLLAFFPDCPVRTRRNVMYALMRQQAKLQLSDTENLAFIETRQGHFLIVLRGSRRFGPIVLRL